MSKRLMSRMEGNCFETGTNSALSTAFVQYLFNNSYAKISVVHAQNFEI